MRYNENRFEFRLQRVWNSNTSGFRITVKFFIDYIDFPLIGNFLCSEAINIAVLEMSEDGTLNNLKRSWWYEKSECQSGTAKVRVQSNLHSHNLIFIELRNRNKIMH